ncbi:MAG: hypothetical protein Q8S73_41770 [Deltaproteobacteria bacterium]|nr:hypothetical protein [Myxococcales bacterium]MDP3220689.1 hypothetical protein [Deltaproteobacteria bacterium]
MSPSPRPLHAALALVLAASLPQCASAPSVAPVVAPPPPPSAAVELAVDTGPVARPDDAVVTLRIASVRGLARRLGDMLGLREFIEEGLNAALPDVLGDEAAARAVDLEGPLELVVAFHDNDVEGMASFALRSLANTRTQLADGHTLETVGNPSLQLQRVRRDGARPSNDELILSPSTAEGGGRLLMVRRREGYEGFVNRYAPYLSRTLAAQPLAASEGAAVIELQPQVIDRAMRRELEQLTELADHFAPGPDPNNPQFSDAARAWLRDALAAVRSTLAEARDARLALDLGDAGATLRFAVAVQSPSAQLAQQALAAVHDSPPPMDLYERLPPGGWTYSAWALHAEPLRATLNLGANAVARMITPRTRLPEADATALRTALGALVAQDRVAVAATTHRDAQDRYTSTSLLRVSTPSPQFVANVRALVTTLRRPAVARAVRADLRIDPMGWTLPPTTGLPAGSLLLRGPMPTLSSLRGAFGSTAPAPGTPAAARPGATPAAARPVLSELLLVPEGDHVWVVLGGNARTQFQSASGAHGAPPTIEDATAAGTSSVVAILPGAISELVRDDTTLRRMIDETIAHGGAAASAPSIGRLRTVERDGITQVSVDLAVPRAALGLVGQSVQRGLARP